MAFGPTRSPHLALIASNFDQGVANAASSRRREQMLGRVHKLRRLPNRVTDAIALAISQTAYEEFDFRINGPVEHNMFKGQRRAPSLLGRVS